MLRGISATLGEGWSRAWGLCALLLLAFLLTASFNPLKAGQAYLPSDSALTLGDIPHNPHARPSARQARVEERLDLLPAACFSLLRQVAASPQQRELRGLTQVLAISPLGAAVLRDARYRGVLICLDEETNRLAYYLSGMRVIAVRAQMPRGRKVAFLAHELAHVTQHPAHSDNRYFPAEDLLLLRRSREADAEATAVRIAWQLRQRGFASAWNSRKGTVYRDILRSFAQAMAPASGDAAELRAARAAYDQWFRRQARLDLYDRMTLAHLERISKDSLGLVPPHRFLSDDFLARLGSHGADNYLALPHHLTLTGPHYRRPPSEEIRVALEILLESRPSETSRAEIPGGALP